MIFLLLQVASRLHSELTKRLHRAPLHVFIHPLTWRQMILEAANLYLMVCQAKTVFTYKLRKMDYIHDYAKLPCKALPRLPGSNQTKQ